MSSEIIGTSPGLSRSDERSVNLPGRTPRPQGSQPDLPALDSSLATGGTGTSSVDELTLSLGQVNPDPYLEEFQPEPAPGAAPGVRGAGPEPRAAAPAPGSWALENLDVDVPQSTEITAVADPFTAAPPSPPTSTAERFAALDLNAPLPSKGPADSSWNKNAANEAESDDLGEDDDDYVDEDKHLQGHRSLWMALLTSYASAVTLGLIWVLWGHRVTRESPPVEPDPFPAAETTADPGHRAGQSHKVVAQDPLPPERIVGLGQTLVIDALEVTPLKILAGPVVLKSEIHEFEARRGGNDALVLKLRLKNLSSDSTLVPLDEAFIRERNRGIRDTFIAAGPSQQIDMFPLAVVSEWSIAGQEFRELRPGESYETAVVSVPDALGQLAPEMTWQLRLRTDVNQTGKMGIRFHQEDIRRPSRREMPAAPEPPEKPEPGDDSTGTSGRP